MKSYTDLEQSKKLAEILPSESADMHYSKDFDGSWFVDLAEYTSVKIPKYVGNVEEHLLPCWSLAALLNIMPKDKSIECSISFGYYNGKGEYIEKWLCAFEKEGETTDNYTIETFDGDNPVDACYEMVLKLHELKML